MDQTELTRALHRLNLSKGGLARLVGVTDRAVNMWLAGEREVPGPVQAYLRLLRRSPEAVVAQELAMIRDEDPKMYEGIYSIAFQGQAGEGIGMLIFQKGTVYGTDIGGVQYDGTYQPNPNFPRSFDIRLKVTVPPGVGLVTGVEPQTVGHWFDVTGRIDMKQTAPVEVQTTYGPVLVAMTRLRDLPKAA